VSSGVSELRRLYTDYLLCAMGQATATELSALTGGLISHDKITRYLATEMLDSSSLWQAVKPYVREIERNDGALIIDDTIVAKPHTDESELICWHYSHTAGRAIKGMNTVTALYQAQDASYPVASELVQKPKFVYNTEKQRMERKALISKHDLYRSMIITSIRNGVPFKYVFNDVWYASAENMSFVVAQGKHFVMPLKSNRLIALSEQDAADGNFQGISRLKLEEGAVRRVFLDGVDVPLLLIKQVFKNGDGSVGILYLVTSDLTLSYHEISTTYQRRWRVESFFKSWKQHAALGRSPTKVTRAQRNHFYLSLIASIQLEALRIRGAKNHFAMRTRLFLKATQAALAELQIIRSSINHSPSIVA